MVSVPSDHQEPRDLSPASSCQNRRSFFSSTYELPPFSSRKTVSFFSYAYKLPIFYPLCFDIHASDGGCRGSAQHSNLKTCQHSNLAPIVSSRWPDRKNNPLTPAEEREKPQQLFPREIFLVEQVHPADRFRARHDLGSRVHPIAQQLSARVARRNSHARIISDAFHFSRNTDRVYEKLRVARIDSHRRVRRKPYRRLHALAALLESFEVQILVPGKHRKSHRLAPSNSMQGILRRTQKSRTDIPVCPGVSVRLLGAQQTQRAPRCNRSAIFCTTSKKFLTSPGCTSHPP